MKFLLTHTAQGKPIDPPISLDVQPEPRSKCHLNCQCRFVLRVAPESVAALVSRRLVLEHQSAEESFVCGCLGVLCDDPGHGEAFQAALDGHLETWGSNCGAPLAVYRGHLEKLLEAHAAHVKAPERTPFTPTLARPICAWDCESTGIDPVLDRLVSLGVTVLMPDGSRRRWETLINPEMPIPPEVTKIHGITDEMVASAPTFRMIAAKFLAGLAGKDMLLYNGRRLDLPLVDESLRREGMKLDLAGVRVIDAAGLFFKLNPRDLSAFVERYAGRSHEGAHGAAADAEGTLEGWLGLMGEHAEIAKMSLDEQATFCLYGDYQDRLPEDLAGKLYRKNGEVYFAFGKAKDKRVVDDPGYAEWILRCYDPPFPGSTRECLIAELDRLRKPKSETRQEFLERLEDEDNEAIMPGGFQ